MHKIQMFFPFNSNSPEKKIIGSKKNVQIKCLLPLFGGSERDEQEGIRFGEAAMYIFKSTIVQKQFLKGLSLNKNHLLFSSISFHLPLFVSSEPAQQEGIRFGGAGMQIS